MIQINLPDLARSGEALSREDMNGFRTAHLEALETPHTFVVAFGFDFSISRSPKDPIPAHGQTFIASHADQGLYASSE